MAGGPAALRRLLRPEARRGGRHRYAAEDFALRIPELRERFGSVPGQLRGYLTVVPESRWLKHTDHQRFFHTETTGHYEDHLDDLAAILAAAGR